MPSSPITSSFSARRQTALPTLQPPLATHIIEPTGKPAVVADHGPDHWAADDHDPDPFKIWRFFHGDLAEAWIDRFFQLEPDMYEMADYALKLGYDDLTERDLKELLKDKQDLYAAIRERDRRSGYLSGGLYATTPNQSHPLDVFYYRNGTKFKPAFPHHTPLPAPPKDFHELIAYYLLGTSLCWTGYQLQDFGKLEATRNVFDRYGTLCEELLPQIKQIWHKHEQYCGCCQGELRHFLNDRKQSQKTYTPLCKADMEEVLYGFNCPAHGPHQRCFHIVKPDFEMQWKPIPEGNKDYYVFYGTPYPGPFGPKPIIWDSRPHTKSAPIQMGQADISRSCQNSESTQAICYVSSKKRGRSTSDLTDDVATGVNNKRQRREPPEEKSTAESRSNSQEEWNPYSNPEESELRYPDASELAALNQRKREEELCPHKKETRQVYSHLPPDLVCWTFLTDFDKQKLHTLLLTSVATSSVRSDVDRPCFLEEA